MKTKTTETTKTTQTVTINKTVQDDSGMDIARMTSNITNSTPFGNNSLVILNKSLFDANKEDVRKLYLEFEEEASNVQLADETSEKESNDDKED